MYQVYPRSFCEQRTTGEYRGEGNLDGVTSKLDYLRDLGVTAIWLSPFYPSPMVDSGYDVSDYVDVDPRYGNLADFDRLIAEAHSREIQVMVDIVPNHTSDQHPWFAESAGSRHGDKADWYIWQDPAPGGGVPNNWASVFSLSQLEARKAGQLDLPADALTPPVSGWTFHPGRGQYYFHSFATEQPDVNWQNAEVRQAIAGVLRFWIERGVDGFRIDAVPHIGKDPWFRDEPYNEAYREGNDNPYDQLIRRYSCGYEGTVYEYLGEMAAVLDEYPERDLRIIFEAYMEPEELRRVAKVAPRHSAPFNFTPLDLPWQASAYERALRAYYAAVAANPGELANQVMGNHDKPRVASRLGALAARTAAVVHATLPGMIFIYNGEEAGFTDVKIPADKINDTLGFRDPARTPMLWAPQPGAGFSEATDFWLPIDPEYAQKNIQSQLADADSFVRHYMRLLQLRKGSSIMRLGDYTPLQASHTDVLAFARRWKGEQIATIANFTDAPVRTRIAGAEQVVGRIIEGANSRRKLGRFVLLDEELSLAPHESMIIVPSA